MPEVDTMQKHMFAAAAFTSALTLELRMLLALDMENYYDSEEMNEHAQGLIKVIMEEKERIEKRQPTYIK